MAQIGDILEKERKRETDCDGRVIHLFQEGCFYRAYERSAWLCVKHVNPQMKVTRKALKGDDESFCFVGFPVTSLPKYSPDGAEASPAGEKEVDIVLPEDMAATGDREEAEKEFEAWKQEQPLTDPKQKDRNGEGLAFGGGPPKGVRTITEIMHDILAYPVESKSPIESMLACWGITARTGSGKRRSPA